MQIDVQFEHDSVWLNRQQMADLFGRDIKTIGKHLTNIFKEGELEAKATVAKFATVQSEGDRTITRQLEYYNLDVIISVGYRVKSKQGTQFRIWATQRLKDYLIQGYALNDQRLKQKEMLVRHLKTGIQILGRAIEEKVSEQGQAWLQHFVKGLELLDDYDHENLDTSGNSNTEAIYPTKEAYRQLIRRLKSGIESEVFGVQKDQGFESAISQIAQGFGQADVYPSLEEKAAMLLYLITKNHSFADGNKRIAAVCFLLFLEQNNMLINQQGAPIISHEALASLTLFVAASKPEEMETVKNLIISVLNRNQK